MTRLSDGLDGTLALSLTDGSNVTGAVSDTNDQATGGTDITLASSTWTGIASGVRSVSLDAASTWTVPGASNVGSLANAGRVALSGGPGTVLTVGTYAGNGGTLAIETVLGGSGSATDRLVVTGTASGSTNLAVTNVGGTGALTTGNGILVVEGPNGADASGAAFTLADKLRVGLFQYQLATVSTGARRAGICNRPTGPRSRPTPPCPKSPPLTA